ncbi:MAG TPA: metallophosphoesterase [Gemmatimonadaceae bacterium]|nr:metallophosphoesterase [Gemmatimonadaceae bacterium]
MASNVVRLAALADIHYSKNAQGQLASLFAQIAETADVMLLAGDLTDYGLVEEARVLAKDLAMVKIPIVAVLGNHDFESCQEKEIAQVLSDVGVHMLDGDAWEHHGIGFAGVRGFCGGFGRGALGPWGEKIIKDFVHEAVQEALKLESALARLKSDHRVVLMHYAPIRATVEGEPPEIFPFLGSSRLEEPLTRFDVTAVFHGHAHKGAPEGATQTGIPVFNVAHAVLKATYPDRPPFRLFDVHAGSPQDHTVTAIGDRRKWGRRASDREDGPDDTRQATAEGDGSDSR